eukprot:COSAG01_NODE_16421_length_1237_cov_1.587873_1_plen_359_part_10
MRNNTSLLRDNRVAEQLQRDLSELRARSKQLDPGGAAAGPAAVAGEAGVSDVADGVDRRLEAYNTIPVVSSLLFGTALAVVLMLDHEALEGCHSLAVGNDDWPSDSGGESASGAGGGRSCTSAVVKHLATAPLHLTVGLNLFATMVQTVVFYFGKRTLAAEKGHGDYVRRTNHFLDRATSWRKASFWAFIGSIPCFGVGVTFTVWVLLPASSVPAVSTVIYAACIGAAMGATLNLQAMASEEWGGDGAVDRADRAEKARLELALQGRQPYVALSRGDDRDSAKQKQRAQLSRPGPSVHADPTASQAERQLVLAAVAQDGRALQHADASLKKDREVVLAAVAQHGDALQHADASLRKDRE